MANKDKDKKIEDNTNANKRAKDAFNAAGLTDKEKDKIHISGRLEDNMSFKELKSLAEEVKSERSSPPKEEKSAPQKEEKK